MIIKVAKFQIVFLRLLTAVSLTLILITASGLKRSATAQEQKSQQTRSPSSGPLVISKEDYKIGPKDVIEIQIEKAPELSKSIQVGANGTFIMPFLGRITAEQKTPEELAVIIADGLRGRYLRDPQVTVSVKQYNSCSFFVQGSVRNPGVYQIDGKPSLMKLITIAGGLEKDHGSTAFIIREVKAQTSEARDSDAVEAANYELLSVNISGLFKGQFDQNRTIEPGDIVNIPPSDLFFVTGEVHSPGSFPLKDSTTLRQAISLAQGTTFEAAKGNALIFRENPANGKREELRIDLNAVMNGKKEDVLIRANDVIIVPNSRFKTVSGAMLRAFGLSSIRLPLPYRY